MMMAVEGEAVEVGGGGDDAVVDFPSVFVCTPPYLLCEADSLRGAIRNVSPPPLRPSSGQPMALDFIPSSIPQLCVISHLLHRPLLVR